MATANPATVSVATASQADRVTRRFDARLLERRRIAAGLTINQLGERVGVPGRVVRAILDREAVDVPLSVLDRLGAALDCDPVGLLRTPARPDPRPGGDGVALEAALLICEREAVRDDLADALGWSL